MTASGRQSAVSANRRNASVGKAVALLRAAAGRPEGASVSALARTAGIPRATALRMIDALEAEGLVTRLRDRDVVLLGAALADIAAAVRPERLLVEAARAALAELGHATDESATLTVRAGGSIVCVHEVAGPHLIGSAPWLGRSWPLHVTAAGKLALATMTEPQLAQQLEQPLTAYTELSITDPQALRGLFPRIRTQGFATSIDELEVGLTSIAVPVPWIGIEAFAGVSGPTYRLTDAAIAGSVPALLRAAGDIAAALRPEASAALQPDAADDGVPTAVELE